MSEHKTEGVPHISGSAIINLSVSGAMIARIQSALLYLVDGMKESDTLALKNKVNRKETLSEKESAIVTISTLILAIEQEAKKTNQLTYKSIEDTFTPQ